MLQAALGQAVVVCNMILIILRTLQEVTLTEMLYTLSWKHENNYNIQLSNCSVIFREIDSFQMQAYSHSENPTHLIDLGDFKSRNQ